MNVDVTLIDILYLLEVIDASSGLMPGHYGSVQGGDFYFQYHLANDAWISATTSQKIAALVQSTLAIDALRYIGERAPNSLRAFPRRGYSNVPSTIEVACYENALALLKGVDPNTELDNLDKRSRAYSNVRFDRDMTHMSRCYAHGIASQIAWLKLIPWLEVYQTIELVRG